MATLVTGGRGFVGKRLVSQLLERGCSVVSYNRDFATDERDNLVMVQGELFDLPALTRAIDEHGVTRIIHTAGQSHPGVSVDIPITTFAANSDGTLHVFEAARMTGVQRVVSFSSECAYGNLEESAVVAESTKPTPTTPYGVTKVAGELLGGVYNDSYGMSIASLRITEVYGPGLWMPSLLCDILRAAVVGRPFHLAQGSDHPFQFVFVDDVANAAILASEADTLGQPVYNVSGGTHFTIGAVASMVRARFPRMELEVGPGHLPNWDRMGPFDLSAAQNDFGYTPGWTFDDGLTATIEWLRTTSR